MLLKTSMLVPIFWIVSALIHTGSWPDKPDPISSRYKKAFESVYDRLQEPALNRDAFVMAMLGYRSLCDKGLVMNDSVITVIDYSLPSTADRFFVIDLHQNRIVFKTLVAHGRNSGELYASRFSNRSQSHQSALGFYITGSTYQGGQGYSMWLTGVDTGYNDRARIRSIVIHGASYATRQYALQYGRLGRSFGCPALPPKVNARVIDCIKEGSVVFSYFPDREYFGRSPVLGSFLQENPSFSSLN